jgi:hypothetical protein
VRCREVVLAGSLPAHDLLSLRCRMKPANGKPQRFKVIHLSKMVGGLSPTGNRHYAAHEKGRNRR